MQVTEDTLQLTGTNGSCDWRVLVALRDYVLLDVIADLGTGLNGGGDDFEDIFQNFEGTGG